MSVINFAKLAMYVLPHVLHTTYILPTYIYTTGTYRMSDHIRDFAFFVFERTKHQPRRNLRSYLVLQRLCNEAALIAPALMHFGTKSWSKMVVSWRYADLSVE